MKHCLLRWTTALLSILLLCSTACSSPASPQKTDQQELTIVTSFYPMYLFAYNVAAEIPGVYVENMASIQSGCLHDYQLTFQDMQLLEQADILVINGAGMEAFLDDVVDQFPDLAVIDSSEGIALLESCDAHHDHEHDHEHDANAHIWVSIDNACMQVANIADGLMQLDTAHADAYRENAAAYTRQLEQLSAQMHEMLAPLPHRNLITFHEAFPYFAQEFNFVIEAVLQSEPGQEPSAQRLTQIIDLAQQADVPALFTEVQYADTAAKIVSQETNIPIYELDLLVNGSDFPPEEAYQATMLKNANILCEALS